MTPRDYDNGFQAGITEATLDGLAKAVDEIRDTLKTCFPCSDHDRRIGALESGVKIGKWIVGLLFGGGLVTGVILLILSQIFKT